MKKTIFYVITLALVLWLQLAGNFFLGTGGLGVNLILVSVLYLGLAKGPLAGETMGFIWGLLIDASSLGLIGLHGVLYAGAGFLAGMLRRQLDENKMWTQSIFTAIITVIYLVVYILLDALFSQGPHAVSWGMLAQPLTNGLLAPVVFWSLQRWSQAWFLSPQED